MEITMKIATDLELKDWMFWSQGCQDSFIAKFGKSRGPVRKLLVGRKKDKKRHE